MKTAWQNLWMLTAVGSLSFACTVTTTTGENGGSTSLGGSSSGGSSSGGASLGGSTSGGSAQGGSTATGGVASGGKSSSGGANTSGGSGPVPTCDTDLEDPAGTPASTCEFSGTDNTDCHKCLSSNCCAEVKDCFGTNPYNVCAYGGPTDGDSEFFTFELCLVEKAKAGGGFYSEADEDACIAAAQTPACPSALGTATSNLIACSHDECEKECFETPAK